MTRIQDPEIIKLLSHGEQLVLKSRQLIRENRAIQAEIENLKRQLHRKIWCDPRLTAEDWETAVPHVSSLEMDLDESLSELSQSLLSLTEPAQLVQ